MPYPQFQPLLGRSLLVLLTLLIQAQTTLPSEVAQTPPTPHHLSTLSELITDLRSPTYATRESATAILIRLSPDHLSDIESALANEKDEEAIARLTRIATHLYLKELTPLYGKISLLGMAFIPEPIRLHATDVETRISIVVAYLHPGFPAAEVLKPGDRLIALNGNLFTGEVTPNTADEFRAIVNTGKPGSFMNFTVIRDGHELQVAVQLAGIPENVTNLEEYILQRTTLAVEFANALKTGRTSEPIVMGVGSPENP